MLEKINKWMNEWLKVLLLQGWTYAVDFPATYTKDKKWNSCVRRRRWLRYRRYQAMDSWAKVSLVPSTVCKCVNVNKGFFSCPPPPCPQIPSQQTTLPDPFSDISCGGWEVSEEPRGHLSLWAVSLQGKVAQFIFVQFIVVFIQMYKMWW